MDAATSYLVPVRDGRIRGVFRVIFRWVGRRREECIGNWERQWCREGTELPHGADVVSVKVVWRHLS